MSHRKIGVRTISAIFILIIAGLLYYYEEVRQLPPAEVSLTKVAVAKTFIPHNTPLTEDMFGFEERYTVDLARIKDHIILSSEDLQGKITLSPIYPEEIIVKDRLKDGDEGKEEKKTEFTMKMDEYGKALDIGAGSFIDMWYITSDGEASILFSELEIKYTKDENFNFIDRMFEGNTRVPSYLVMDLTDDQIRKLLHAQHHYSIKFSKYGEELLYTLLTEEGKLNENNEEPKEDSLFESNKNQGSLFSDNEDDDSEGENAVNE